MIDTVRLRQPRYLRDSASRRNWEIRTIRREVAYDDGLEDEYLQSYNGIHKKLGIRFFGSRDQIITVEASLPRVLFGHNGRLLLSQAEINAALRKLDRTLGKISQPPEDCMEFLRVDLVWHVPGSCAEFVLAHRDVRHPRVRKVTCVYDGESITWGGSALRLMIYDKAKRELGRPGDFVRVEAQIRGHMLTEFFDDHGHVLDFGQCYRHLRKLVLQLEPPAGAHVTGIASLLAKCKQMQPLPNEVHPVEAYLLDLCPRRQRDLRRQIAGASVASRRINWPSLLPEMPPESPPQLDTRSVLVDT